MVIAGIDANKTKIAVSRLDGDKLDVSVFATVQENRALQLFDLGSTARELVGNAQMVFVEEAQVGKGVRSSLYVAQTTGAIGGWMNRKTYFVPVSSWKKRIIGNGQANKTTVSAWLLENMPVYAAQCEGDQDLIDATCIALYGAAVQNVAASLGLDGYQ